MRFAFLLKASADSEAGQPPSTEILSKMMAYNTSLVNADVLESGDGLSPSSAGFRVVFPEAGKSVVVKGPFPVEEVVCGYWIVKVGSQEEAVDWATKAPLGDGAVLEVRRIFGTEDMGEKCTEELKEEERKLRERAAKGKGVD